MEGKLIIRIRKDGSVQATTQGIKGKRCLKYMSMLEKMTNAEIVDSEYTNDFYESIEITQNEMNFEEVRLDGES